MAGAFCALAVWLSLERSRRSRLWRALSLWLWLARDALWISSLALDRDALWSWLETLSGLALSLAPDLSDAGWFQALQMLDLEADQRRGRAFNFRAVAWTGLTKPLPHQFSHTCQLS